MRLSHFAASVVLCAACTSVQSADVKTAGMSAIMQVSADATGATRATAEIHVDNNDTDFVTLSSGDALVVTAGSQSQTMSEIDFAGGVSYQASFSGLDANGTQYTIAFNRTSDVSAPSSTCMLPNPFNITAPTANSTFSRASDNIMVTYDTMGTMDQMNWSAGGDCVQGEVGGTVASDSGTFTVAMGSLVPTNPPVPATCQAHITLTRSRPGQLDSHFGSGGSITARQVRTVTFNSTP